MARIPMAAGLVPLAALAVGIPWTAHAAPLGSAFTYQALLRESGQPATGLYDLQVCLFDGPVNPVALACAPDAVDVPVDAGVFTIALDFGTLPFAGEARFLELRVRPGASAGAYTILAPRQMVRPTPEALRSATSSAAPWSGLSGMPAGFSDGVDDNGGGTVTSVATGTGLSGGPVTGSGVIAIASGGVGTAQLADGAASLAKLASNSVDAARVVDDSLAASDLAANAVGASELASNAVDTAAIVDASVTAPKIAAGAVGLAQINATQVQSRIGGNCPLATYLRGINADGSVVCTDLPGVATITTVDDPAGFVGFYASLAIGADGLPVVSYLDSTAGTLKVAKCANAACTGTATITTVDDPTNFVGQFTSIAIGTDGFPVISYLDNPAGALKVAKCANTACTGTATITTVDNSSNFVGSYTSIAIGVDGLPVVSYQDETAGSLKVAKCANAACTGTATITTVDDPPNLVGEFTSLAIGADALPVISYYDRTAGALKVAKCANAACTGTATITTVDDPANDVGSNSSLAIGADGLPVISHLDFTAGAVKVAKCGNAACTGAATITTVADPVDFVGEYTSLAIGADGLPAISYLDDAAGALKLANCANAACTGTATITTVDDPANRVGVSTSLAIGADGLPVIGYLDFTAGGLKVVKCGSRNCR